VLTLELAVSNISDNDSPPRINRQIHGSRVRGADMAKQGQQARPRRHRLRLDPP